MTNHKILTLFLLFLFTLTLGMGLMWFFWKFFLKNPEKRKQFSVFRS